MVLENPLNDIYFLSTWYVQEEYDNVPSSSSDDDDWDKTAGKEDFESAEEGDTVPLKQSSEAEDHTATKKPRQKSKRAEDKKETLKAPQESSGENGCSGKKSSSSAYKQTNPRTQVKRNLFVLMLKDVNLKSLCGSFQFNGFLFYAEIIQIFSRESISRQCHKGELSQRATNDN